MGGHFEKNLETSQTDFFARNGLPELSIARVLPEQIDLMFAHYYDMNLPTAYD